MMIVIIQPIGNLNLSYIAAFSESFDTSAKAASSDGAEMAENVRRAIIKSEAEAYVLDKAGSYGLSLEVQVNLSDESMAAPESVFLIGDASPYARTRLQNDISDGLGIPKERQTWIG